MRYQLDQLREVRKSRQEDINEIVEQNAFLSGAHRKNKTEIHEEIQHRLKQSETPQVSKTVVTTKTEKMPGLLHFFDIFL